MNQYFKGLVRYFYHRWVTESISKEQIGIVVREVAEYGRLHVN